jgi:hypothetical protein
MISIGIILLVIGVCVVIVSAVAPIPPPIGTLGWIALGIGILLVVLGLVLPALGTLQLH